ncbi:MAG: nitrilase-related carbon-nitrogen hydrolase, partial [Gallionella sp.]|nr:nitrilase-related carbon-nitrogen hydrolase [Gallionella sp.]
MKLAIAQINCVLGDLTGNVAKILQHAEQARQQGAQLLITPELSLCGYPPEDLLLRDGFHQACAQALADLAKKVSGIAVVVGHPHELNGKRYNAASLLRDGRVSLTYLKNLLPNYSVFDEKRYFDHGSKPCVFEIENIRFALNICAEIWEPDTARQARDAGAQVLLVLNASPYAMRKQESRHRAIRERIAETGMAVIYANTVGGQDELIFDGGSFAMDRHGVLTAQGAQFEENLLMLEMQDGLRPVGEKIAALSEEAGVYRALCLGVRDYIEKNHFPGVLLGLSGGIDSALTLAVAVDALG